MTLLAQTAGTQRLDWQLQTHWTWAPWFTVLFVLAAVALVAYLYARETSPAGGAYRALLGILRLTSIGLVLLMLSELLLSSTRSGLPRLMVLLDHSASMGLEQGSDTAQLTSRIDRARELLLADDARLLAQWQQTYRVELAAVADDMTPLRADDPATLRDSIQALDTRGPGVAASRLGDAVVTATGEVRGTVPAAVVLLTDGRNTAGRSLDEARELARRRGVPLYTVGYGPTDAPPDVALANLLADRTAFKDDLVALQMSLTAIGAEGQTLTLRARDTTTGKIAAEQTVQASGSSLNQPVQLVVRPEREGETTYEIEVDTIAGERDVENNRLEHTVDVRDEQVGVLVAGGYPNYEFRYLKNLLERDRSFNLTTYLQEADIDYAQQDATATATLPVATDGLDDFDVLVLIDLNPRLLPPRWWQNVERHVAEQGGGLVLVAGPRHYPWAYSGTPLVATLSPLELAAAGRAGGLYDSGFRLELTPLGQQMPMLQLGSSPAESTSIWESLPPFYWYVAGEKLKPAARVLAVHPTARTPDGNPVPLLAMQYVGAGRVLYQGVDSTWRWRMRVGDVFFARYWGQSLRQLARGKRIEAGDQPQLVIEKDEYQLGQRVKLRYRAGPRAAASGRELEVVVTSPGQPNRRVRLEPSSLSPDRLEATLSDLAPGSYRVTVGDGGTLGETPSGEFTVVAPPGELADPTMNQAGLRQLAEATYGKFYTADTAQQLAADLPTGQRVPLEVEPPVELWNQWWMLAAITVCLCSEWILRKRRAML